MSTGPATRTNGPTREPCKESLIDSPGGSKRFDPEHHGTLCNTIQGLDFLKSPLEGAKGAGMKQKYHVDELGIRFIRVNR